MFIIASFKLYIKLIEFIYFKTYLLLTPIFLKQYKHNSSQTDCMILMTILTYFIKIQSSIFIDRYVVITKSGSPELQFALKGKTFSMKYVDKKIYEISDENLVRIAKKNEGYVINFYKLSLYDDHKAAELIGGIFKDNNEEFIFDIYPVKNGVKFRRNERCLEKMGWNEEREGFYVGMFPCVNNPNQVFTIRPVPVINQTIKNRKLKINLKIFEET
ncbi:hypothetical protein H312_01206 [Anncaliia algerae PRA339]|uniref:Uncharacterized protein n=1 Tax=Anncaliia algerae PRA339 TaxID=1288291 RepID=A0A059F2J1_9MICR|nr:hypothetical protein H312_01206 [Anncaliia algerae PRA339]